LGVEELDRRWNFFYCCLNLLLLISILINQGLALKEENNSVKNAYYIQKGDSYAWKCTQMVIIEPGCGYYYFPFKWEVSDDEYLEANPGDCVIYDVAEINDSIWVNYFFYQNGRLYPYIEDKGLHRSWVYIQSLHANWTAWAMSYYSNHQAFRILWDNETDFGVRIRFGSELSGDIHEVHFSKVTGLLLYAHAGRINQDEHGFYNHTMILLPDVPKTASEDGLPGFLGFFLVLALGIGIISQKIMKSIFLPKSEWIGS
jgi:hypothetical protein